MSVNEAVAVAKLGALIDRVITNPSEHCTDLSIAFRLCVLRRWITRAGGNDVEFRRDDVGWMFTRRGEQVAREQLQGTAS